MKFQHISTLANAQSDSRDGDLTYDLVLFTCTTDPITDAWKPEKDRMNVKFPVGGRKYDSRGPFGNSASGGVNSCQMSDGGRIIPLVVAVTKIAEIVFTRLDIVDCRWLQILSSRYQLRSKIH
ncbi:hypothetical protein ACEPPN_005295 [Leptodophora sp. 'Broadleaf-Isolate-01']